MIQHLGLRKAPVFIAEVRKVDVVLIGGFFRVFGAFEEGLFETFRDVSDRFGWFKALRCDKEGLRGGIMSATLALLLKQLEPSWKIVVG